MERLVVCAALSSVAAFRAPVIASSRVSRPLALSSLKEPPTAVDQVPTVEVNETAVELLDVEVSQFDDFLIQWGVKEDPRIPEECRVAPIDRIKSSGRAGVAAYALTEGAFWLSSVPLAVAAVAYNTGSLPDVSTLEGKEQIAGYVFAFTTFARALVPVRIALALALAPWCDQNIIQKFFPPAITDEDCEIPGN
mmetsp:Transcript_3903/g.11981  ORF Transcript_3903/g.11981 Transcript_3903/m.11981 type:complete len:194 (+) Transcript_3903:54-635(+)|eukprot:CAMPEP_0197390146 /NCGR_PEP_ID=MMETSP1165-20131217/2209_1 /TAXON_ID=284809 /ORGANISM="Chrysocystis fragilis, Strain CCMP3189" /LENGTH=193 /DNA_ID=CAMNT_0042915611 /DNA_START=39 /DNA_END=620 /DNA_ORIENTATION=-